MSDNINTLREQTKRLLDLLSEPHPGLMTWQESYRTALEQVAQWWDDGREVERLSAELARARAALQAAKPVLSRALIGLDLTIRTRGPIPDTALIHARRDEAKAALDAVDAALSSSAERQAGDGQ